MNLLTITDTKNGHVQLTWQRDGEMPNSLAPIPFQDPLTEEDRKELRWYLEEYLQFPYGAERDRAQRLEEHMQGWGVALFKQLFPKGEDSPDPREFYQEAVRGRLDQCQLCISSDDSAFLNIPWELLHDPTPGRGYLAPLMAGFFRQRSAKAIQAPFNPPAGQPFRILLVIARPYGARDIPLGTVARPLLEAIRPMRPALQLDILRPPTFEQLTRVLTERPGYYNLVHFDGHGVFAEAPNGGGSVQRPLLHFGAREGRGQLVFETTDGKPDPVSSERLGNALATARVPLFVLNACQSAEEGADDPFSSVAAQLVAVGAKGVLAMSYSVYATTAALFIHRFYERVVGGASLAQAVAAARMALFSDKKRQSVVGLLPLSDWIVPSLYQQEVSYTPLPAHTHLPQPEQTAAEVVQLKKAAEVCPAGRFGFIGRDYAMLQIERHLQQAPFLLLCGIGGSGKTELAYGFARWYAETGGCPGGVFAASFKEKASFAQVMGSIVGYGTDFSRLPEQQQWDVLVNYLRENACLLVWDNFETVAGYPTPADALAEPAEREKLARFLQAIRGGKSRVLITTRKPDEGWLGVAYRLFEIGGLNEADAGELAKQVLGMAGKAPEDFKNDADYARLLRLLKGHPRSLELVLPRLRVETPTQILQVLQHEIKARADVLDASLAFAFERLSPRAQKHLPLIGLFAPYVYLPVLKIFVAGEDEQQTAYQEVTGEALDEAGWWQVLGEAAAAGLLRLVGQGLYELHPTLPLYLRERLVANAGEEGFRRLDEEYAQFYAALAEYFFEELRKASPQTVSVMSVEEGNFLRSLRLLEMERRWGEILLIAASLYLYFEIQQRVGEWSVLRDHLLSLTGWNMPPDAGVDRVSLWNFVAHNKANYLIQRNELAKAQLIYEKLLAFHLSQPGASENLLIPQIYHQLGMVAQARQQYDQAEGWYRKALEILERLGLERDAATDYHQLGMVAQERQQYDQAEGWYRKALEIHERLGLERDAATDYHQLGMVAQARQQYDQAEGWYRKALEIHERLGLERDAATDYHQLGMVAQARQQYDQAEGWYRKALEIYERLGLEREAANGYHQLGNVAYERQQYDQAEGWYRKALVIKERLGLERDAANDYHQLGRVAEERQQYDQAKGWYRKALEIKERLGLERDAATEYHQLGMVAQKRQQYDQAEGWYRKALEVFERVGHPPYKVNTLAQFGLLFRDKGLPGEAVGWLARALVIAAEYQMRAGGNILWWLARLLKEMGEAEFTMAWKQAIPDQEPPLDVLNQILRDNSEDDKSSQA